MERAHLENKCRTLEYELAKTKPEYKDPESIPQIKEAIDMVRADVKNGNRPSHNLIPAIKLVRQYTGLGLKEAKEYVETASGYVVGQLP
jgi:ribosomal protein L7/L12